MASRAKILIIDQDSAGRARLREVLRAIDYKCDYSNARSLAEGLSQLEQKKEIVAYDYVFVASYRNNEEAVAFLAKLASLSLNPQPLVIFSLDAAAKSSTGVAELYARGAHGFICEPYSADELRDLMSSAQQISSAGADSEKKNKRILRFLFHSAVQHFEKLVSFRILGKRGDGDSGKMLKEISTTLKVVASNIDGVELADTMYREFGKIKPRPDLQPRLPVVRAIKEAPHPGNVLQALMKERELSEEVLLKTMKVSAEDLSLLLNQQISLTEDISREIARALGKTAKYWYGLQLSYDQYIKAKEEASAKLDAN